MKYILLLDDDPDELFMLQEAFAELQIAVTVKWFQNFQDLCTFLDSGIRKPDMLFLDINMPRESGMECLARLKAEPRYAYLPVIIYTNSDYYVHIDQCFELGASVYLKKSNSFEHLKRNLLKVLAWNLANLLTLPPGDRTILN